MIGSIVQDVLIRIRATTEGFNDAMRLSRKHMNDVTKEFNKNTMASRKNVSENIKMQRSFRAFRFELLSTMFFGQMLQKTMMGLLQPAFETAGIFDIISTILEVFFLPVALALLDPLLAMMDWFMGMPEEVQLVIGAIVLFLGIIGAIIAVVSQVGLLLGSFGMTFTSLGPIITGAFGTIIAIIKVAIASLVAVFGGWAIVIIAIVVALILAILFNIEGFVGVFINHWNNLVDSVSRIFGGLIGVYKGIWDMIVGIFTGNQDMVDKGWKSFLNGVVSYATGIFDLLIGNFLNFGLDIGMAIVTGLGRAYGAIKGAIAGIPIIGPLIVGGLNFVDSIAGGISNAVGSTVQGIANGVSGFFGSMGIPGFANGGIVTRPTLAMVGEAGPEAIVPLGNNNGVGKTINYNPTYQFNNEINNANDIDYLISEIERKQGEDYERLRML